MVEREVVNEKEILAKSEVSLLINSYNDIFSSFDPRPYSQRSLSVDFLDEAKRATREIRPGIFELRFLIPKSQRSLEKEAVIKKRLREHFKRHTEMLSKERKGIIRQGIKFVIGGVIFMLAAAYIMFHYGRTNFIKEFLVVLLEPGGWFLFWEGMSLILFKSKAVKPDLDFYLRMNKAEIIFNHY